MKLENVKKNRNFLDHIDDTLKNEKKSELTE